MKKLIFFSIILIFFYSCKSVTTIETIPENFEVPATGISPAVVYAEVYVANEAQEDISIIENNFYYKIKNLSHTYSMNLKFMICLEGEAEEGTIKTYPENQARWDDPSKTIVLANDTLSALQEKSYNTELNSANNVLLKLLKQDHFYVVVKNEIPSSYSGAAYTNTPVPTGTTSTIKITYPEDKQVLRDGKIRIRGIYDSSTYTTGVSISVGGVLLGTATTSGDTWYYDLDALGSSIISFGNSFKVTATASSGLLNASDSVDVTVSPALDVTDFYARLKIESEASGIISLFSIF